MVRRVAEWRRRGIGGAGVICGQTWDDTSQVSGDDGRREPGVSFNVALTDSYSTGQWSGKVRHAFMRFPNVTVPAGATIESCVLNWKSCSSSYDGAGMKSNLLFEAADDPAAPTTGAEFDGRTLTSALVAYDDYDSVNDSFQDSPDITTPLQEVIDRGGWSSGNALILYWMDDGTTNGKLYCNHHIDAGGSEAAILEIQYCA